MGMAYPRGFAVRGAQQHWALPLLGTEQPWDEHLPKLQCFGEVGLLTRSPLL